MYNVKRRRGYDGIVRLPHRQKWRPRGRYATKRRKLRLRPIAREEETDSDSESKVRRVQLFRLKRTFKERPEEEREDKDKLADCKQCSSQAIPEIMSDGRVLRRRLLVSDRWGEGFKVSKHNALARRSRGFPKF